MTKSKMNNEYFEWMCQLVCDNHRYSHRLSHRRLLRYLHHVDFYALLEMDDNRMTDGIDLRYRFGYEFSYDDAMIAAYLDDRPCSVLEMMVALSMRCEEQIMDDPEFGNRMGEWFWNMLVSMKLGTMNDERYDEAYISNIVSRFLERNYDRDGQGGLFTLPGCSKDLRTVDIWCQMCWYLADFQ